MKTVIASLMVLMAVGSSRADELNDMPELACARASSDLEREQIGCRDTNLTKVESRQAASPLVRSEDE